MVYIAYMSKTKSFQPPLNEAVSTVLTSVEDQNTEVGIYGLALNPKRRKSGWLASYLEGVG